MAYDPKTTLAAPIWNGNTQIWPRDHNIETLLTMYRSTDRRWRLHTDFQRKDHTWPDELRKLYIDSIEKNVAHLSVIHVTAVKNRNGGLKYFLVLDGGHRLNTLVRFCGLLGEEYMFKDLEGRKYSDFTEDMKYEFGQRMLHFVEYSSELTIDQQSLIFDRINKGLTFSPGETICSKKVTVPLCGIACESARRHADKLNEGINGLRFDRHGDKCVTFTLAANFLRDGKPFLYEKAGATVEKHIDDVCKWDVTPSGRTMIMKQIDQLMSIFPDGSKRKYYFTDLVVAQHLMLFEPDHVPLFKMFVNRVYDTPDSQLYHAWVDAVRDSPDRDMHRNGFGSKNLDVRLTFFKSSVAVF